MFRKLRAIFRLRNNLKKDESFYDTRHEISIVIDPEDMEKVRLNEFHKTCWLAIVEKEARKQLRQRAKIIKSNIISYKNELKEIGKVLDEEKVSILEKGYECRWDYIFRQLEAA